MARRLAIFGDSIFIIQDYSPAVVIDYFTLNNSDGMNAIINIPLYLSDIRPALQLIPHSGYLFPKNPEQSQFIFLK